MELVNEDGKTVTLRLEQVGEFGKLLDIMLALGEEYAQFDSALLTVEETEVKSLLDSMMRISKRLPYKETA